MNPNVFDLQINALIQYIWLAILIFLVFNFTYIFKVCIKKF